MTDHVRLVALGVVAFLLYTGGGLAWMDAKVDGVRDGYRRERAALLADVDARLSRVTTDVVAIEGQLARDVTAALTQVAGLLAQADGVARANLERVSVLLRDLPGLIAATVGSIQGASADAQVRLSAVLAEVGRLVGQINDVLAQGLEVGVGGNVRVDAHVLGPLVADVLALVTQLTEPG